MVTKKKSVPVIFEPPCIITMEEVLINRIVSFAMYFFNAYE